MALGFTGWQPSGSEKAHLAGCGSDYFCSHSGSDAGLQCPSDNSTKIALFHSTMDCHSGGGRWVLRRNWLEVQSQHNTTVCVG